MCVVLIGIFTNFHYILCPKGAWGFDKKFNGKDSKTLNLVVLGSLKQFSGRSIAQVEKLIFYLEQQMLE